MEHYLIVFKNSNVSDMKVVAKNPEEAKEIAVTLAKFAHKDTRVTVKEIWLCTRI